MGEIERRGHSSADREVAAFPAAAEVNTSPKVKI